jgi:hypothetical protein
MYIFIIYCSMCRIKRELYKAGCRMQDAGCRMQEARSKKQDAR